MKGNIAVTKTNVADVVSRIISAASKPVGIGAAAAFGFLAQNATASEFDFEEPIEEITPILDPLFEEPVHRLELPDFRVPVTEECRNRTLRLDLVNPLDCFDANAHAWYSAVQLGGCFADLCGSKLGLEDSLLGRLGLAFFDGWWTWGMSYVSHEIAHDYMERWSGNDRPVRFDLLNWRHAFPEYIQKTKLVPYDPSLPDPPGIINFVEELKKIAIARGLIPITYDEYLFNHEAGLYQNEFNASSAFRQRTLERRFGLDHAFAYLLPKIGDSLYSLWPTLEGDPVRYLENIGAREVRTDDDVTHDSRLVVNDIKYTMADFQRYAALSDLLSASVWESAYAILDYVFNGKRIHTPVSFDLGFQLYPPDIRMFPSIDGFYLDAELPLGFKDRFLFANFGSGVDNFGDEGRGNWIRFGAQFCGFRLGHPDGFNAEFSPFVYLNIDNRGKYKGHSVGFEGVFNFGRRFALHTELDHTENDVIENVVKFGDRGVRFRAGLSFRY